jgi:hypothetical protein
MDSSLVLSDVKGSSSMVLGGTSSKQITKKSTISFQEERELRRVYDRLCDYHVRSGINSEIKDLQSWQYAAKMKVKANLQNNVLVDQNQVDSTHSATQRLGLGLRLKLGLEIITSRLVAGNPNSNSYPNYYYNSNPIPKPKAV